MPSLLRPFAGFLLSLLIVTAASAAARVYRVQAETLLADGRFLQTSALACR